MIDDCGADYVTITEDAPSDCIQFCITDVLVAISLSIGGLVRDVGKALQMLNKPLQQIRVDEELQVSLLINMAIFWTPAILCISRLGGVYSRL